MSGAPARGTLGPIGNYPLFPVYRGSSSNDQPSQHPQEARPHPHYPEQAIPVTSSHPKRVDLAPAGHHVEQGRSYAQESRPPTPLGHRKSFEYHIYPDSTSPEFPERRTYEQSPERSQQGQQQHWPYFGFPTANTTLQQHEDHILEPCQHSGGYVQSTSSQTLSFRVTAEARPGPRLSVYQGHASSGSGDPGVQAQRSRYNCEYGFNDEELYQAMREDEQREQLVREAFHRARAFEDDSDYFPASQTRSAQEDTEIQARRAERGGRGRGCGGRGQCDAVLATGTRGKRGSARANGYG